MNSSVDHLYSLYATDRHPSEECQGAPNVPRLSLTTCKGLTDCLPKLSLKHFPPP